MTKIYCARWVLPILSEPIEGGAVAVQGVYIAGVGARRELEERFPSAVVEDFGEAAIMPGFVNCHTHLELTAMRGFLEPEEGDFFAWLRRVSVSRGEVMSAEDLYTSAAWGAVEAARAGITSVGDASASAAPVMRALGDAGLRGIVYQEAFGPDSRSAAAQFDEARAKMHEARRAQTRLVTLGLSPHAPYSVSPALLEMILRFAEEERMSLMMHVAESEAERELMTEGGGIFAAAYAARGFEFDSPRKATVRYLADLGALDVMLLAHCVRVDGGDIELMSRRPARVAHCPKSNAKLGHGRAPLAAMLRAGVKVGLGSDSVASNNTCDMLEEARFAVLASRAACETVEGGRALGASDALHMATRGGANALGVWPTSGTLYEGLEADLVAVRLDAAHLTPAYDPAAALVFSASGRDVLLTVVAGREVFRDGRVTTLDESALRARVLDLARRLAQSR